LDVLQLKKRARNGNDQFDLNSQDKSQVMVC